MMDMSDVWKIYDREISETPMPSKTSPAQTGSNNNTFFSRGISKHGLCCPMQGLLERGPWKVPHPWYGKATSFTFDFELYLFQV